PGRPSRRTRCPERLAGSSCPAACSTRSTTAARPRCWPMSRRTWPRGTTCSPPWRTWRPRPTRCCCRWPARWTTPWNGGPTSAPTVTGDRRLVAATIGRVALLTPARTQRPRRTRAAALAITGTRGPAGTRGSARNHGRRISLAWAGPVPRRVAALLAPPPGRQLALLAVATLLVLIAGVSAAEAARDLHALVEFAQSDR